MSWPKYPRWREMGIPKPNRSRRARGKQRLRYWAWRGPKEKRLTPRP